MMFGNQSRNFISIQTRCSSTSHGWGDLLPHFIPGALIFREVWGGTMMFASAFCLAVFFFDAFLSFSSDYMWSLSDQIETCFLMLLDHLDIFGSFGIIWKRNMTRNSEHLPQALDIVSNIAMVCDITINATSMINQMKPPMFVVPSANQNCVLWMNISNPIESSQSPSHQEHRFPWFLDEFHWNL